MAPTRHSSPVSAGTETPDSIQMSQTAIHKPSYDSERALDSHHHDHTTDWDRSRRSSADEDEEAGMLGGASSPRNHRSVKWRQQGLGKKAIASLSVLKTWLMNPIGISNHYPFARLVGTLTVYFFVFILLGYSTVDPHELTSTIKQYYGPARQSTLSDEEINWLADILKTARTDSYPRRPLSEYASPDPMSRAIHPLKQQPAPFPYLRPGRMIPDSCLEMWLANGESMCSRDELGEEEQL